MLLLEWSRLGGLPCTAIFVPRETPVLRRTMPVELTLMYLALRGLAVSIGGRRERACCSVGGCSGVGRCFEIGELGGRGHAQRVRKRGH